MSPIAGITVVILAAVLLTFAWWMSNGRRPIRPQPPTPVVAEIDLPVNMAWKNTGILLAQGTEVTITAGGVVEAAGPEEIRPYYHQVPPEGRDERAPQMPQPGLRGLCLIGKVGASVFYVGKECRFIVDATRVGELWLGINDDIVEDNMGAWKVRIERTAPR